MSGPAVRSLRCTCSATKIAVPADANVILHAVALGRLPLIDRRLDPEERKLIRPGDVFVWEERAASADAVGVPLERWTDSRHWGPSRIRDDFLFYHEKESEDDDLGYTRDPNTSRLISVDPSRYMTNRPERTGPRAPELPLNATGALDPNRLIKQTFSVYFVRPGHADTPRKWHLTTYFTRASLPMLRTVREVPGLRDVTVPSGVYIPTKHYRPPARRPPVVSTASAPAVVQASRVHATASPAGAGGVLPGFSTIVDFHAHGSPFHGGGRFAAQPGIQSPRQQGPGIDIPRGARSPYASASASGLPSPTDISRVPNRRSPEDHRALQAFQSYYGARGSGSPCTP